MLPPALQEEVTAITETLSWVVLCGNALASLLFLWGSLATAPRHWPSIASSGGMLLVSLLGGLAYQIVLLHGPAHAPLFLSLVPLTSSALIAGLYVLTAPHLSLTPGSRVVLTGLMVAVGLSLLGLLLLDLRAV